MSIVNTNKYEVSDPAYYYPLIVEQKKRVRQYRENAAEWLELGHLYEDRIDLISNLAKNNFVIRYSLQILILLITLTIIVGAHTVFNLNLSPLQFIGAIAAIMVALLWHVLRILSSRYPPSGKKYFRRAISLDSQCGEAYMHLGLIALRRKKKQTACQLLERAVELNVGNKKIERKLKTLYEKEFVSFFNKKTDKETEYQEINENQKNEIKALRSKVSSLENLIESLTGKADQAKWEVNYKTKRLTKEMNKRIETVQTDYEKQIADIKQSVEEQQDTEGLAQRDFVRLTTEIMEAKAKLETSSFANAESAVETIIGSDKWQSLLPQTRTYLATAEHTFRMLSEEADTPDYSLIGMELCKALETEINRTLVFPFLKSLNGDKREFLMINQVGKSKGKPRYFTYLAQVIDQHNYPEITTLTLGQYNFVLQRALKGEYALIKYRNFLYHLLKSYNVKIGGRFLKNLETVTNRYRNTITHESPMNKKQCEHLRKLMFSGKDSLLSTCCTIALQFP